MVTSRYVSKWKNDQHTQHAVVEAILYAKIALSKLFWLNIFLRKPCSCLETTKHTKKWFALFKKDNQQKSGANCA